VYIIQSQRIILMSAHERTKKVKLVWTFCGYF